MMYQKYAFFWNIYSKVCDKMPRYFTPYQDLIAEVRKQYNVWRKDGRVLDAGCGTGNFTLALSQLGFEVVAVDLSIPMLTQVRSKKEWYRLNKVSLARVDLNRDLPFQNATFDSVLCVHVLFALANPVEVLCEFHRILKPGGFLLLVNPKEPTGCLNTLKEVKSMEGTWAAIKLVFVMLPVALCNLFLVHKLKQREFKYFCESELRQLLENAGFIILSVKTTYVCNADILMLVQKPIFKF